jgi:signal transduction histidine kinase/CheY-like chemotaxis protein
VTLGYGVAVLSVTAALVLARWLEVHFETAPVSLFLCAVMFSAWFGGTRPGLLAAALCVLAFKYYFVAPIHSLAVEAKEIPRLVIFVLSTIFVGALSAAQRRAAESLRRARNDLQGTVQELEKTNEALRESITERKLADAERARLEQRLRQAEKMEAVGRVAGGIAHDFNNILGGILGYAELLVEGTPAGSAPKRYAQNVLTAANRASALVEQILWYSRSQRGKRVPVELDRIVRETLELVRGSLGADIRLEASLPGTPLHVVGDPTQLHQVTMNLCTNAIHAMGDHGRLRVTLDALEAAADCVLEHVTLPAGPYVRLSVEDSGTGMDAATLARVFEPFFTTKEIGKGTGLGLSLVYGIVTDSGGAVDVSSTVGEGSTFTIYLPRVDSPALADDETAGPLARGNGERVLIVDDEEALLAVTSEVLKRLGYEPVAFADAAAALAEFETAPQRFDAVIADEVMPGLTGTELARSLRAGRADLPIVLVSGYIGPMMTERAMMAGVDEILKKPVQSRALAAALDRVLRRGK